MAYVYSANDERCLYIYRLRERIKICLVTISVDGQWCWHANSRRSKLSGLKKLAFERKKSFIIKTLERLIIMIISADRRNSW